MGAQIQISLTPKAYNLFTNAHYEERMRIRAVAQAAIMQELGFKKIGHRKWALTIHHIMNENRQGDSDVV